MALWDRARAPKKVQAWREAGLKVVFTNGCFDILHRGHIEYLKSARELGDRLIVGLNSDDSVNKLKGKTRPIQIESDRARILDALEAVNAVIIFEEDTPAELIRELQPQILVKGGDYEIQEIAGAETVRSNGGKVVVLPFVEGCSTTAVMDRIQSRSVDEKA